MDRVESTEGVRHYVGRTVEYVTVVMMVVGTPLLAIGGFAAMFGYPPIKMELYAVLAGLLLTTPHIVLYHEDYQGDHHGA